MLHDGVDDIVGQPRKSRRPRRISATGPLVADATSIKNTCETHGREQSGQVCGLRQGYSRQDRAYQTSKMSYIVVGDVVFDQGHLATHTSQGKKIGVGIMRV